MTDMPTYSSKQVCEVSGCTHRQLQYWEIKGYLSPNLGARNVREYSDNDLKVVRRIIDYKKSGKSLGEAFVTSDLEVTQTNPQIQSIIGKAMPLEASWLESSQSLLNVLEEIHALEASIPRFPYSIYESDKLETLKSLQQKAVRIKEQKDDIYHQLQSVLIEKPILENVVLDGPTTPLPVQVYSIDQLVIMWLRRYGSGQQNTQEIRSVLTNRLRMGETIASLIKELEASPLNQTERASQELPLSF
jgi:DNA-binding transcriptional MerR regulator